MALNDNAVYTASRGYIFTAPINTAAPTPAEISAFDPAVGFVGWENIGHTSDDELPEFGFDGGDTETRGSWQNKALKEVVTEAIADYVTFNAHQFDEATLSLYYGVTDPGSTPGVFEVNETGKTTEKALLIVIVDGLVHVGFYSGRTSVRRNDAVSMDTDSFAYLPLRATILKGTGPLMAWISEDTGVNVGS
jgi:hypothetical protein